MGEKVVMLYDGGKGTMVRLAEALVPESASLKRVVLKFPWKDPSSEDKAATELIHFIDDAGVTQVSLIVLRREVPSSGCAYVVHEIFEYLLTSAPFESPGFTLIVPAVSRVPGSALNADTKNNNVEIYTSSLNGALDDTKGSLSHLPKLPSTFTLRDAFLAYLFHFVHATRLPTLVLLGPNNQGVAGEKKEAYEVIHAIGDVVAQQTGLTYSKQKLNDVANLPSLLDAVEDDWRRLYI